MDTKMRGIKEAFFDLCQNVQIGKQEIFGEASDRIDN